MVINDEIFKSQIMAVDTPNLIINKRARAIEISKSNPTGNAKLEQRK